jgi:hypothetical protein
MTSSFDVFKIAGNGEMIQIEPAETLESAMSLVAGLREKFPGDYVILSRVTGKKILFKENGGITRS